MRYSESASKIHFADRLANHLVPTKLTLMHLLDSFGEKDQQHFELQLDKVIICLKKKAFTMNPSCNGASIVPSTSLMYHVTDERNSKILHVSCVSFRLSLGRNIRRYPPKMHEENGNNRKIAPEKNA